MVRMSKPAIVAGVLAIVALGAYLALEQNQPAFEQQVNKILETAQTYDGEQIDKLVELGPAAVPAISQRLESGDEFPLRLIYALERIGDGTGAPAVLSFVEKRRPYDRNDGSSLTSLAILAIQEMPNPAAVEPLVALVNDETAHVRIRIAAAATLAQVSDGSVKNGSQQFILATFENRDQLPTDPNSGLTQSELYFALIDADSPESKQILIDTLGLSGTDTIKIPIVRYLSESGGTEAAEAVRHAIRNDRNTIRVRVIAAESYIQHYRDRVDETIASDLEGIADLVQEEGWPEEYLSRIESLQAGL